MPDKQRLLELALKGLEAERARIANEITEIKGQLNHGSGTGQDTGGENGTPTKRRRRRMSAEAKRKISEAMKRRYAELKKAASAGRR
jgi:hypothetical protein